MNRLNPLEQEALDALLQVREAFTAGKRLSRPDFQWLMGQIRDSIVHLTNKQLGCPTGKHVNSCKCGGEL